MKQHKKIPSSTKFTSIEAALKNNEGYVYKTLLYELKKTKPKFQVKDLVGTVDLKFFFQNLMQLIGLAN